MTHNEVKALAKNLTKQMFDDINDKGMTEYQKNWYLSRVIHTASLELDFSMEENVDE